MLKYMSISILPSSTFHYESTARNNLGHFLSTVYSTMAEVCNPTQIGADVRLACKTR
jgi:hypothetical protein